MYTHTTHNTKRTTSRHTTDYNQTQFALVTSAVVQKCLVSCSFLMIAFKPVNSGMHGDESRRRCHVSAAMSVVSVVSGLLFSPWVTQVNSEANCRQHASSSLISDECCICHQRKNAAILSRSVMYIACCSIGNIAILFVCNFWKLKICLLLIFIKTYSKNWPWFVSLLCVIIFLIGCQRGNILMSDIDGSYTYLFIISPAWKKRYMYKKNSASIATPRCRLATRSKYYHCQSNF